MRIEQLDHLVLTVRDIDRTIEFYCDALGMESVIFAQARCALSFGQQKSTCIRQAKNYYRMLATRCPDRQICA